MAGLISAEVESTLLKRIGQIIGHEVTLSTLATFRYEPTLFNQIVKKLCDVPSIKGSINCPSTTKEKESNIKNVIKYLKTIEINVKCIEKKPKYVLEGNEKLIPVLLDIFLYYLAKAVSQVTGKSVTPADAKDKLLAYINVRMDAVGYQVANFTTDWRSGMALGALVNSINSDLIQEWRTLRAADNEKNVELIMGVADKNLHIDRTIEPRQMCWCKDDDAMLIILYLSQFTEVDARSRSSLCRADSRALCRADSRAPSARQSEHSDPYLLPQPHYDATDTATANTDDGYTEMYYSDIDRTEVYKATPIYSKDPPRQLPSKSAQDERREGLYNPPERSRSDFQPVGDLQLKKFKTPNSQAAFWHQMNVNGIAYDKGLRQLNVEGKLTIGKLIGTGYYGQVHKGRLTHPQEGFVMFAVKRLAPQGSSLKTVQDFLGEAWIANCFNHQNVLKLTYFTFHENLPCMLLPLYEHGNLRDYLKEQKVNITVDQLLQFSMNIARGAEYITNKGYIHRDLAARNCLVTDELHVVVADFGFSRDILVQDYMMASKDVLPLRWLAVEILQGKTQFTVASDAWAYGVVMYEIYSYGKEPYENVAVDMNLGSMLAGGYRLEKPQDATDQIYHLMKDCWHKQPSHRPNFSKILAQLEHIRTFRHQPQAVDDTSDDEDQYENIGKISIHI